VEELPAASLSDVTARPAIRLMDNSSKFGTKVCFIAAMIGRVN